MIFLRVGYFPFRVQNYGLSSQLKSEEISCEVRILIRRYDWSRVGKNIKKIEGWIFRDKI